MRTRKVMIPLEVGNTIGDVVAHISEQCLDCRHLDSNKVTCFAFPDGIPEKILAGKFNHTRPFEGDNGIRFEKRK